MPFPGGNYARYTIGRPSGPIVYPHPGPPLATSLSRRLIDPPAARDRRLPFDLDRSWTGPGDPGPVLDRPVPDVSRAGYALEQMWTICLNQYRLKEIVHARGSAEASQRLARRGLCEASTDPRAWNIPFNRYQTVNNCSQERHISA